MNYNPTEEHIIVGLDIGTTKIACFVGTRNAHGKIRLLGYGRAESLGVQRGVVTNIEKTVHAIQEAVAEAERNSGVEIQVVNVGIAGQHIKSMAHRGMRIRDSYETEISMEDIDSLIEDQLRLVMQPGDEILHVLPQDFTVDGEPGVKDPVGRCGVRLEANFHIITGQMSAIRHIMRCVDRAGLQMDKLILEPLASSASVLTDEEMEAGVVLVDIGGGTTDVAIFQDNIIRHTAVIPLGGNILTEDIKKGCAIMMRQAEKLKTQFGSALAVEMRDNEIICIPGLRDRPSREISRKNLAHIIESRMTEIIELVNYEIVNSGFADHLFGGIVLTGGGAQLKHLPQLVQFLTGMDCRVGLPNEYLVDSPAEAATGPMFATGIGLVIKGFDNIPLIEKTPEFERIRPATRGAQPTEIPAETPVENPFENPLDSMESEPFPTDMEDALPEALPKSGVRLGDRIQGLNERMMKKILDFFQGDSEFQDELDDTPRENRRR
ncbi:MAG: hypothetical protein RJA19_115 [Bacteroidota bacterium]